MRFRFDEEAQLTKLEIDSDDICSKCYSEIREVCPLLASFISNNAYPCAETLELASCCLYEYIQEQQ